MNDIRIEYPWDKPWCDGSDRINPFLQNPILEVLMSQMTIEDLKLARLVCQEWDKYSTTELEKLTETIRPQKFGNFDEITNFSTKFENSAHKKILASRIQVNLHDLTGQELCLLENYQPQKIIMDISSCDKYALVNTMEILEKCSDFVKSFGLIGTFVSDRLVKLEWRENLTFPQLEKLTFKLDYNDLYNLYRNHNHNMKEFYTFFQKISENSPKLKILDLLYLPSNQSLFNIFLDCGLNGKLQEFEISYIDDGQFGILLDMANRGMKLKKFTGEFSGINLEDNEILVHIQKIEEFLKTQADTLEVLKIGLGFGSDDKCKLTMPKLSKLKVLEFHNGNFFTCMDLPTIFPKLREITLNQTSVSQVFKGFLDSVETFTILNENSIKNDGGYKELEKYFPKVRKLSLGTMNLFEIEEPDMQYEEIPWETTLEELTLYQMHLGNLKLESLAHLQELGQLVLIKSFEEPGNSESEILDLDSLAKTKIKSLKTRNFHISKELIDQIREKYILDYVPPTANLNFPIFH